MGIRPYRASWLWLKGWAFLLMPREAFEGWEPGKCCDLVCFIKKISVKAVKGNGCGEQKWKLGDHLASPGPGKSKVVAEGMKRSSSWRFNRQD